MADTKISLLPAAATLTGTETVPVTQGGNTVLTNTANIAAVLPAYATINTLSSGTSSYTVLNSDVNNVIEATASSTVTITIPNSLTTRGSITVSKGGTGNVVLAPGTGVTLDKPGSRNTLATQYETMSAIYWGSLTHYRLAGAES